MTTSTNLHNIKHQIAAYESKYSRPTDSVALLAVSKKQPVEKILDAYHAGQRAFGESYLQEALPKIEALAELPIEWHFIGPIQSNKTRKIAAHFDWVQSIDSLKIAQRLNDHRPPYLPPLNICLEINISKEISKSGVMANEAATLAAAIGKLPRLNLRGLMTIPALTNSLTQAREDFHALHQLWQELVAQGYPLDTLSMGMSDDFEAAIAEGSTLVRIGTAIFGERP